MRPRIGGAHAENWCAGDRTRQGPQLLAGPGPPREIPLSDGPDGHSSVAFSPDGALIPATVQSLSTVPSNEIPRGGIVVRAADGTTPHSLPGVATNVAFLSNTTIVRGELDQTISYWCGP
jgi:hypothetical protein